MDEIRIDTETIRFLMEEKGQFDFLKEIADSPEKAALVDKVIQPAVMRGISVDDALHTANEVSAYIAGRKWSELDVDTMMGIVIKRVYDPDTAERILIDLLTFFHDLRK